MQPKLFNAETPVYCPVCRRITTHHEKRRYTRPASQLERGREYRALVCEDCGREIVK